MARVSGHLCPARGALPRRPAGAHIRSFADVLFYRFATGKARQGREGKKYRFAEVDLLVFIYEYMKAGETYARDGDWEGKEEGLGKGREYH